MRLFARKILWSLGQFTRPVTVSIKFLLRFSSVNEMRPFRFSTEVIRLFARLRTLNSDK